MDDKVINEIVQRLAGIEKHLELMSPIPEHLREIDRSLAQVSNIRDLMSQYEERLRDLEGFRSSSRLPQDIEGHERRISKMEHAMEYQRGRFAAWAAMAAAVSAVLVSVINWLIKNGGNISSSIGSGGGGALP